MSMTGHPVGHGPPGPTGPLGAPADPGPALAMVALGLPMVMLAAFLASDEIATMRESVTVQGRVTRITTFLGYGRAGQLVPSRDVHAPVIAFRTPDGREMEVLSREAASTPCCSPGEQVTVRFPTGAPERAVIVRFWDVWRWPGLSGLVGLTLIAAGWVTWRVAQRRSRAAAKAPPAIGPVRRG